jgi:hypothetical protein
MAGKVFGVLGRISFFPSFSSFSHCSDPFVGKISREIIFCDVLSSLLGFARGDKGETCTAVSIAEAGGEFNVSFWAKKLRVERPGAEGRSAINGVGIGGVPRLRPSRSVNRKALLGSRRGQKIGGWNGRFGVTAGREMLCGLPKTVYISQIWWISRFIPTYVNSY